MAINAEQLNIILSARDKEFTKAMERNQRRVERFANQSNKSLSKTSKNFSALGAAAKKFLPALGAAVVIDQVRRITTEMDEIGKKADQIGLTTDALQELRFVAEGAGVSQEKFTSSMERFSKRLGEAEMGTGAAKKALEELGLKAEDLTAISLDEALGVVADKMALIEQPTERAATAAALFGREGVAMVNMLREGSQSLDKMRASAREAGAVIDEDLIRSAEGAQTRLDAASRVIKAQLTVALADLIPLLVGAAEGAAKIARNIATAYAAMSEFINPTSQVEIAIDNVVSAMGDEIRQSRHLNMQLGKSQEMSVSVAKSKLEEARARHTNAREAFAEARAIMLSSDRYTSLQETIRSTQDALFSLTGSRDSAVPESTPLVNQEMADYLSEQLVQYRIMQREMLRIDPQLADHFALTRENIEQLEEALANARDGLVTFGDDVTVPIEPSERLSGAVSDTSKSIDELLDNLDLTGIDLERLGVTSENAAEALETIKSASDTVQSGMEGAFMGIIDGTTSASDAFRSMARDIIAELYRVLVVQRLVGSFEAGGGGILGSVFGSLSGRASGGAVMAGSPYMVGESGPEPFIPAQNGRILSVAQAKDAIGGGGSGVTVVQNNNFGSGVTRQDVAAMLPAIVETTKAAVFDAQRRSVNGRGYA